MRLPDFDAKLAVSSVNGDYQSKEQAYNAESQPGECPGTCRIAMPQTKRSFRDAALLVGAGVLVSALLLTGLWLSDNYGVSTVRSAAAWASLIFVPTVAPTFARDGQWRKASFLLYFAFWAIVHGLLVASLIRWVSVAYWLPALCVESFVGYLIARRLFGVWPSPHEGRTSPIEGKGH